MELNGQNSDIQIRNLRVLEALLFAAKEPLGAEDFRPFLSENADLADLLEQLQQRYQYAGVNLVRRGEKFAFRTAEDLSFLLRRDDVEQKPLSRAALETLSIIAYHQPVTRSEIEEVRGVATSKGHARRFDGSRLGANAWPPPDTWSTGDLWHNFGLPGSFWS